MDPLADAQGQQVYSPYAAMGNAPESCVDPEGTISYVSDRLRADLVKILGEGNFSRAADGKVSFSDEGAAMKSFGKAIMDGLSGSGGMSLSMYNTVCAILKNYDDPSVNTISGYVGNEVETAWSMTLDEINISPNPYGALNLMQAAALDIGRNDYQRWKSDNFAKIVVAWTGIGAAVPFAVAGGVTAAPVVATSFLGNPVAWTSAAGSVGYGAAGYGGEAPGPIGLKPLGLGSTGRTAAVNLTEQLAMKEAMSNPGAGEIIQRMKPLTDPRWSGWRKMHYEHIGLDGIKTNIHYNGQWSNGVLNAVDDFKFK